MNTIRFGLSPTVAYPPDTGVGIWIDGESLIDRIRMLEASWWEKLEAPQPEGQYVWVPARMALLPGLHLLGEPADPWCGEFSAVVVCCCGEPACRSYAVQIEVSEDGVEWASWLEVPPEEGRLGDALRPLKFERRQYLSELQRVSLEYQRLH
jgi:hypothetical protein